MFKWLSWLKDQIISHPTAIAGGISMILGYIVSQGLVSWSSEQVGLIGAVVTAVLALAAGALTDDFGVALFIALGNAVAALIVGFDTGAGAAKAAAIIGVVAFALGLIHHSKASPKYGSLAKAHRIAAAGQKVAVVSSVPVPTFSPAGSHAVEVVNTGDLASAIASKTTPTVTHAAPAKRTTAKRTTRKPKPEAGSDAQS